MLRNLIPGGRTEERALQVTAMGDWSHSGSVSLAGVNVTTTSALNLLTVYGCVQLIADTIATLPLDIFEKRPSGPVTVKPPLWIEQPNQHADRVTWMTQVLTSLLLDGNAYVVVEPSISAPRRTEVLNPADVVVRIENQEVTYWIKGQRNVLPLLHLRGIVRPGAICGLSPVEAARQSIGLGLAVQEFGSRFFANGTNLGGVIEVPGALSPEAAEILGQKWGRDHQGLSHAHEPGVLVGGAEWKPTMVTPEQAQFLNTREFTATEIAAQMFLVDPTLMGLARSGQSVTYANLEQRGIHLAQYTLMRWIVRVERALDLLLPVNQYAKVNVNALQRADIKTRYEAHAIGITNGFLTVDEARDKEDLRPLGKVTP